LIDYAIDVSGFHIKKLVTGLQNGVEYGALRWANAKGIPAVGFDIWPYKQAKNPETARMMDMLAYCEAAIVITEDVSDKWTQLVRAHVLQVFIFPFSKSNWRLSPE
jgi:hypothetical protein